METALLTACHEFIHPMYQQVALALFRIRKHLECAVEVATECLMHMLAMAKHSVPPDASLSTPMYFQALGVMDEKFKAIEAAKPKESACTDSHPWKHA